MMVFLSKTKRLVYEKAQPRFWKHADNAEEIQAKWFEELLDRGDHILLTSTQDSEVNGFIIARLIEAPGVYNPGGLTLMIDDFCVSQEALWDTIGAALIAEIKRLAKPRGASQVLVVSGAHDIGKLSLLKSLDLSIASSWWVGDI